MTFSGPGAILAALLLLATALPAAQLGDAAPPLRIQSWIKGKPTDIKDGKTVHVIEFWATWCGPCRTTIPHLTELQNKFKKHGVTFVGVTDESPETVKAFVEKMGDQMEYTVACDDSRSTSAGYMDAFGQRGIPHAFVVAKSGEILWHGHPMDGLSEILTRIVAGKYNLATVQKSGQFAAALRDYQELARDGDERATDKARQLLADAGQDTELLCQLAIGIAGDLRNRNRDFALARKAIAAAEAAAPKPTHNLLHAKAVVLFESGRKAEAILAERQAVAAADSDAAKNFYERVLKFFEERKDD